uniref:TOG domain-containing protein n=1 Tax=Magallana gigas TaxID=29159 RepID=A0A8W8N874_MAGGI
MNSGKILDFRICKKLIKNFLKFSDLINSIVLPESTDNDVITTILTELSNHNKRNNERKDAMLSLIKMTREGNFNFWDEHFKTILFVLLETLGDTNGHIRALALRVLREILKNQPSRFKDYTELTILRILEAHKDSEREVVRSAEECADTLANYLPPETCVRILNPIISTANYPVSLAAIKMQNKVLELLPKDTLEAQMAEIIPGLLRGYDDQQSTVRKSAVFCLVAIYLKVGEGIWNHLTKLNYSKVKLLNLYIKRAQQSSSVYWLCASTWLLIWVGLVLAQGTKGKEIRKPIQYCNSLVLEERNFLVRK